MAWTEKDYDLVFGKGAWKGRMYPPEIPITPVPRRNTVIVESDMAAKYTPKERYMASIDKLSLPLSKEKELANHIQENLNAIQRRLNSIGIYTYEYADKSYVTLRRAGNGKVTGEYKLAPVNTSSRSSYYGNRYGDSVPKTTGKYMAEWGKNIQNRNEKVRGAFASLGQKMWEHGLKPLLMPLHEWLKVKEDEPKVDSNQKAETTVQVRDNPNQPSSGSTEGDSQAL